MCNECEHKYSFRLSASGCAAKLGRITCTPNHSDNISDSFCSFFCDFFFVKVLLSLVCVWWQSKEAAVLSLSIVVHSIVTVKCQYNEKLEAGEVYPKYYHDS